MWLAHAHDNLFYWFLELIYNYILSLNKASISEVLSYFLAFSPLSSGHPLPNYIDYLKLMEIMKYISPCLLLPPP